MTRITILIVYTLLLLGISLIPMDRKIEGLNIIIDMEPSVQNLLHIPAYAILSILWLQVLGKRFLVIIIGTIVFGIVNEAIQLTIPGRYPSVMDMALNAIGALLGAILYFKIQKSNRIFFKRIVCG